MLKKVEDFIQQSIAPGLAAHGGRIELVDIDNNIVFIRLSGGCQGCASASLTLTSGIESSLKSQFPDIIKVVDLTKHNEGENPYY